MVVQQHDSSSKVRFRPRRLAHANLFVGNYQESTRFYNKVCGFEVVSEAPVYRASFLTNGNTHHDLALPEVGGEGRRSEPGLNHLGWEMENEAELVAAYQRALDTGVKIDFSVDHVISRGVYATDPDGNRHEFYADMLKDWRKAYSEVDVSPKWMPGEPPPITEHNYDPNPEIRRVEDAIFHPRRITHATVVAANFDAMLRFYRDVAGLDVVFRGPDDSFAVLSGTGAGHDLALFRALPDQSPGLHHIGFVVDDERDMDEAEERLKKMRIEPELRLDHDTKRSIYLRSPDGLLLEFYSTRSAPLTTLRDMEPGLALHLA